jgi:phage gpG-like protein
LELGLHIALAGDTVIDRKLGRIAIALDDFKEPLREVGDIIYDEIGFQFTSQGRPKWPALSSAYAARKAKKFPGKTMLIARGLLAGSLTHTAPGSPSTAPGAVYLLTKDSITIGSDIRVGKWNLGLIHQLGAERANIPARKLIVIRQSARTKMVIAFRDHIRKEAVAQGLHPDF